ncbi:hypothetical protein [Vibrio sp. FJH11]
MKSIIAILISILFSASCFSAEQVFMHYTPNGAKEKIKLEDSKTYKHRSKLYTYMNTKIDTNGTKFFELHHSNGTTGEVNIYYRLYCITSDKKVMGEYRGTQNLGTSRYGSVKRSEYWTIDCPEGSNLKVGLTEDEVWNPETIILTIISAYTATPL